MSSNIDKSNNIYVTSFEKSLENNDKCVNQEACITETSSKGSFITFLLHNNKLL